MRHIRIFAVLILCLPALAGCACKHQWTEASCLTPKTCTLCEETEGEPAGHIWAEATCEAPKTCSVCAVTEGQPLAHSEAVRECNLNYTALTMERQTYCSACSGILSSEEIPLDALHDGTRFLMDSQGFLERYTAVEAQLEDNLFLLPDSDFTVVEITEDTLVLDLSDRYGYSLRVNFFFRELTGGSEEEPVPRCTGIVVDPAVSGELGDPDPNGMLDPAETSGEQGEAQRLHELADTVALNSMMFRNLMVGFMVLDPSLETNVPGKEVWTVLLNILDVIEGENPGFVLNDIHYCSNENGELVIEPAE